jgi:hypothetical protein
MRFMYTASKTSIYILSFTPVDDATPEVLADVQRLYQMLLDTWTFPNEPLSMP